MPSDRMAEPIQQTGRAPVVDIVAPPETSTPADTLSGLLPHVPLNSDYTDEQRDLLVRHARAKRRKAEAEAQAKGLRRDIAEMLERIIEMKAELAIATGEWEAVPDTDVAGFELRPYERRMIWPKYRDNPDTDTPYEMADVVVALQECGYGDLIVTKPDSDAYTALVRRLVKSWRTMAGKAGRRIDGVLVDAFDTPLTPDEAIDPTADILGLPPALRAVIEPTETLDVLYTRAEMDPTSLTDAERAAVAR
jgi:hypothetical protein